MHLLASVLFALTASQSVIAGCFVPNGTDRHLLPDAINLGFIYQPCAINVGSARASMCCRGPDDVCQSNGLCFNSGAKVFWRESCSDSSWTDPGCLQLCLDGTDESGTPYSNTDVQVTPCDDGSICCGPPITASECCRSEQGFLIIDGEVVKASSLKTTTSSTSSSTSTTSSTTSSTQSSTSAPSTSNTPSQSQTGSGSKAADNTKAIIGGTVGGVGGLLLFALAGFIYYRRRQRKQDQALAPPGYTSASMADKELPGTTVYPLEIGTYEPRFELHSEPRQGHQTQATFRQ